MYWSRRVPPAPKTMLQWGHAFSDVEMSRSNGRPRSRIPASMGPRLFRRGNNTLVAVEDDLTLLQWGHAFSDVEIKVLPLLHLHLLLRFNGATPFQTWKFGLLLDLTFPEPRLQWGHAFSDVEISQSSRRSSQTPMLQWGHAFSDVEIDRTTTAGAGPRSGFNGATPFQTWK